MNRQQCQQQQTNKQEDLIIVAFSEFSLVQSYQYMLY